MEIGRLIYKDLWREIREPQVLILTGPRQVGKTTLLSALEANARKEGLKTRYLDLEQPADLATLTGSGDEIIDALVRGVDIVFVDEFYYLEDAGRLFKAIVDRGPRDRSIKIVASGSSSVEIHGHLKESLAGRTITYRVFPLTHEEYRAWDSPQQPGFAEYLTYGGLPGLSSAGSEARKQKLLQDYLSTYIFKDVKGLVREENIRAFNQLLYLLAQNQGQLVEASRLARELGMTSPTVGKYLNILDQTFVNFQLPCYHTNLANELKKSRKTYLYDLGIRNSILKDFRLPDEREDAGCIYESYVFLSLLTRLAPNMELRFWRTKRGEEVDLVLLKNRNPFPIEVKKRWPHQAPPPGVAAFCRRYPEVRQTFTVSAEPQDSLVEERRVHHFLAFEQVAEILERLED